MSDRAASTPFSRRSLLRGAGLGVTAVAGTSLLGACTTASSGPGGQDFSSVAPVERGELDSSVLYKDGYIGPKASAKTPFGDGTTEFRIVVPVDQTTVVDWNDNRMTDWFEQRTGVKVVFDQVIITTPDGATDMTKVNAMLASGELPDAFLGIPFSMAQISLYGSQGLFVDQTQMIEKFAPETRAMWTDYPEARNQALAADGKIYTQRGVNDCYHCKTSPGRAWLNMEYVQQVGGAMPTTTEELFELLTLFKEKDPTPGKNIIPLGAGSAASNDITNFIMNAFLYNNGATPEDGRAFTAIEDGKITFQASKDEWREGLKFMRRLFDAGLVSSEAFTMNAQALLQAGNQGRFGMVRAYYWGSFADIEYDGDPLWKKYSAVPPLKGPNGVQYAAYDHYVPYGLNGLQITSKCAKPEVLVQWGDTQMELEAIMWGYGGEEGNWKWGTEGQKGINGEQALYSLTTWPAPANTSWAQYSNMYRSDDFRLGQFDDPASPNFEVDLYKAAQTYEKFAEPMEMQVPPLLFNEEQLGQAAQIIPNVRNHVRTSAAEFTTGAKDINDDAAWQTYIQTLESMRVADLMSLMQTAYDNRPK